MQSRLICRASMHAKLCNTAHFCTHLPRLSKLQNLGAQALAGLIIIKTSELLVVARQENTDCRKTNCYQN